MSVHLLLQVLSVLWAIVSFYLGGLGLLVAITLTVLKSESASRLGGWRRILFNLLLIASGIVGLAWAFDPGRVVRDVVHSVVALTLLAIGVGLIWVILSLLTRGRVGRTTFATW